VFHQYEKLRLGPRVIRNGARSSAAKSCCRYGGAHKLQLERPVLEYPQVRLLARPEGILEGRERAACLCGGAVASAPALESPARNFDKGRQGKPGAR